VLVSLPLRIVMVSARLSVICVPPAPETKWRIGLRATERAETPD